MLYLFLLPESTLADTSRTPPSSRTARVALPATSPRPGAGRISTRELAYFACSSWGIELEAVRGGRIAYARARRTAFSSASAVSAPLPIAHPTAPRRLPTTTAALKLKRRPPFPTRATRLSARSFSSNSERALAGTPRRGRGVRARPRSPPFRSFCLAGSFI